MSKEGSDEWVSDSGDSGPAEEPVADEEQASGPFPRRSLEEVEKDAYVFSTPILSIIFHILQQTPSSTI